MNTNERRIMRVLFSPELLVGLTHGTFRIVENSLPSDVRPLSVAYDVDREAVSLTVEHPSFERVLPGCVIPIHEPPTVARVDAA